MKALKLTGLQPERVFAYFEKICSIPHGSYNTDAICEWLVSFAKERNLRYIRDEANNLIIFKPASAGCEDREPVILQAHMDMVCQKDEGVCINMQTQPVDVTHDGELVFAKGTTLGADDGMGIAMILAILEDENALHPPLEIIITSEEEVGLVGANAIDLSMLKGRRMLNLDTHNDQVMNAGCAGGARVALQLPVQRETSTDPRIRITIEGLSGGHSGSLIGNNLANANKEMAELLQQIAALTPIRIETLSGGVAGNVIPSFAQAVIACDEGAGEKINDLCNAFTKHLRGDYEEPNAVVMAAVLSASDAPVLTLDATQQVLALIRDLPNGVQQWSPDFAKLPLTSLNLGVVKLEEQMSLLTNLRSGVNQNREELQAQLRELAQSRGCSYEESGIYSAWEFRKDSPLRDVLVPLYQKHYGTDPVVRVIHAGLECGVLSEKLPGLDCVSMGSTAWEIHTSRERLSIASAQKFYAYLREALANL